jgi:tight adherence protein B
VTALGRRGDRSIVLLSDGGDTRSKKATKASATKSLRQAGIRAEVIGFKTGDSDNAVLDGFASAGGGSVAQASDATAVEAAFGAAAKTLESQIPFFMKAPDGVVSKQDVVISGLLGDAPFEARTTVSFGASVVPTPEPTPSALAPEGGPPGAQPSAVVTLAGDSLPYAVAAVFVGLVVLVIALAAPALRSARSSRISAIEQYVGAAGVKAEVSRPTATVQAMSESLVMFGDRAMEGRESTTRTMSLIERADLPLRPGEWWVLRIASFVIALAVSLLLLGGSLLGTLAGLAIGVVVGAFGPAVVLRFLAKRRASKFEAQLPDVLFLMASSLSTGFSLLQALDAVAKDTADPAAKEFSRALAETRIGADVATTLEKVGERMGSTNMEWTAMAIRIQRNVGGNLADTLRTTGKTLREREELRRHVRGLSAEGRLSAYILMALPVGLFVYLYFVNRDYISQLWLRPLGLAMVAAGLISMGFGAFWMRRVVDVKV